MLVAWLGVKRCFRRGPPSGREVDWTKLRRQVHQHSVPARQEHRQERDQRHEPAASSETAQPSRRVRGPTRDGHGPRIVSRFSLILPGVLLLLNCGSVAEWLGSRNRSRVRIPAAALPTANNGQVVYTHVPLSPSSIICYQPLGGDPRWLEGGG